jgi:hypothetical protein
MHPGSHAGPETAAWDPASHPSWLNEDAYRQEILPLLKAVSTSGIPSALGVSWTYASKIRKAKRLPHPRHWQMLAELVGTTARN